MYIQLMATIDIDSGIVAISAMFTRLPSLIIERGILKNSFERNI
jgi:hypothetical protein